ncbi:serine hydrolase domain-containing protein [Maribacter antarcticus]|uniref:serine hydrolase domain-containing protein n=1 Tax=Maribacter antarcticus TaxID=505250 RepID=UPI0004794C5E|nr:serine hydrolase domain-containing protein [Maribacter antarcticus]
MKFNIFILFLLLSGFCFGQSLPKIDSLIKKEMKSDNIAALAVAVIDSGRVVHLSANGFKDLDRSIKASVNTPFHIASVSKTVTNLAVFKLVESKKLDLNTDVNKYLPFEVKNPHYPNDIITIRELLNHRSGIKDDYKIYESHWNEPKGDPKLELGPFLKDYLNVDGKLYTAEHFESDSSYKSFSYSNTGIALLGLIVETASGMTYEEFCQANIFKPIGMSNTSWFLKNLDSTLVAKTYVNQDSLGFIFKGHNGYPDYPGGQLRTSISDFSNLIVAYLNSENNKFILDKKTTSKITPVPQISQEGYYTWFLTAINNHLYYTHSGGDTGVRTIVIMDVIGKRGIVIFANSEFDNTNLYKSIEMEMWSK